MAETWRVRHSARTVPGIIICHGRGRLTESLFIQPAGNWVCGRRDRGRRMLTDQLRPTPAKFDDNTGVLWPLSTHTSSGNWDFIGGN